VTTVDTWRRWARQLKTETYTLYLACRDPRVPWYAKALAVCVVAYAFSPIDLIPDFVPLLGYLDDLVLVPLGVLLVLRLIPPSIVAECRERARATMAEGKPASRAAAAVIVGIWLLAGALALSLALRVLSR
jgi:uncharacterized membrane protein YkvA (DUF1232 family)